jgi:hypothetical protein
MYWKFSRGSQWGLGLEASYGSFVRTSFHAALVVEVVVLLSSRPAHGCGGAAPVSGPVLHGFFGMISIGTCSTWNISAILWLDRHGSGVPTGRLAPGSARVLGDRHHNAFK